MDKSVETCYTSTKPRDRDRGILRLQNGCRIACAGRALDSRSPASAGASRGAAARRPSRWCHTRLICIIASISIIVCTTITTYQTLSLLFLFGRATRADTSVSVVTASPETYLRDGPCAKSCIRMPRIPLRKHTSQTLQGVDKWSIAQGLRSNPHV